MFSISRFILRCRSLTCAGALLVWASPLAAAAAPEDLPAGSQGNVTDEIKGWRQGARFEIINNTFAAFNKIIISKPENRSQFSLIHTGNLAPTRYTNYSVCFSRCKTKKAQVKTTRAGTIRQLISYKFISNFFSNNNGHIFRIKMAKKVVYSFENLNICLFSQLSVVINLTSLGFKL